MAFHLSVPLQRLRRRPAALSNTAGVGFALILAVCALCLTACGTASDPGEALSARWRFSYQEAHVPKAVPLVHHNVVIASAGTTLVKLNLDEGKPIWQRGVTEQYTLQSKSLSTDGRRIYTGHIRDFRAYDLETGDLAWIREVDGTNVWKVNPTGRFASAHNLFLAGGKFAELYALDASTGELRYRKEFERGSPLSILTTDSPNKVYLARAWSTARDPGRAPNSMDGRLTAFDPVTGDTTWSFHTQKGGFTWGKPVLKDEVIYGAAAGIPGAIVAVDAQDGTLLWELDRVGVWASNVAVDDDRLYASLGYDVVALDRDTGQHRWTTSFEGIGIAGEDLVLHDGLLYLARNTELLVLDAATGEILARTPPPDGSYFWNIVAASSPDDGPVLIAQTSHEVVAYDAYRR